MGHFIKIISLGELWDRLLLQIEAFMSLSCLNQNMMRSLGIYESIDGLAVFGK